MKLYATVTSERASKGQGGNEKIEADFSINRDVILTVNMGVSANGENYSLWATDENSGETLFFWTRPVPKLTKGEKQKGECEHEWSDEVPNTGKQFCETCGATRTK